MPSYLGNFPNTQIFGEFPKYPVIWEISKILKRYSPQIPIGIWENLGNSSYSGESGQFPKTQTFGKFPRYPGIWEISQIAKHLGNFPDSQAFEKFPKNQGIWEVPSYPGISSNTWDSGEYPKYLGIWEIRQISGESEVG